MPPGLIMSGMTLAFSTWCSWGIRSGLRQEFILGRTRCQYFSSSLEIPDELSSQLSTHPIYLSLDIDMLDPSIVPGTGTPEARRFHLCRTHELFFFFTSNAHRRDGC